MPQGISLSTRTNLLKPVTEVLCVCIRTDGVRTNITYVYIG